MNGLTLIGRNGAHWRWIGHTSIENRAGATVRLEVFERPCRHCHTPFSVTVRLPRRLHRLYLERRERGLEVLVREEPDRPLRAIEVVNCPRHRGFGAPLV